MHLAAEKGKHLRLKPFLSGNVDIPNEKGATALFLSAYNGHLRCVNMLLDAKANVDAVSVMRTSAMTAVMIAAKEGHLHVVDALLAAGADVHALDRRTLQSALHYACAKPQHHPIVNAFLAAGAKSDVPGTRESALYIAVFNGCQESLELLIAAGARVSGDGPQALHTALQRNHLAAMRALIAAKADVNARAEWGITPLMVAAKSSPEAVGALLAAGARVGDVNVDGQSALGYAVGADSDGEAVEALVEARADVSTAGTGITAMFLAVSQGRARVVRALLRAKADVNSCPNQFTPSDLASHTGNAEVARLLEEAGGLTFMQLKMRRSPLAAAVAARDDEKVRALAGGAPPEEKQAALLLAVDMDDVGAVRSLLAAGARCGALWQGDLPLGRAARQGRVAVVKVLLEAGADVGARDGFRKLAMHHAAEGKHREVAEVLLAKANEIKKANK